MKIRSLTSSGDFTFGSGRANYATEERAIESNIATRILSWKNDCFFDFDAGIDWITRLDKGQKDNLINDLKILLIQSYGVMKINSVVVAENPLTRALNLVYDIATIYSPTFTRGVPLSTGGIVGS